MSKFRSAKQRQGYFGSRSALNFEEPQIKQKPKKYTLNNHWKNQKSEEKKRLKDRALKYNNIMRIKRRQEKEFARQRAISKQNKRVRTEQAILSKIYTGHLRPEDIDDYRSGNQITKGHSRLDGRFG